MLTVEQNWALSDSTTGSDGVVRSFYSTAPQHRWDLQIKIWTVLGAAFICWGAVFGSAALIFGG